MDSKPFNPDKTLLSRKQTHEVGRLILDRLKMLLAKYEPYYDDKALESLDERVRAPLTRERYARLENYMGTLLDFPELQNQIATNAKKWAKDMAEMVALYEALADININHHISRKIKERFKLRQGEYLLFVDPQQFPSGKELVTEFGTLLAHDLLSPSTEWIELAEAQLCGHRVFRIQQYSETRTTADILRDMTDRRLRPATRVELYLFYKEHPELWNSKFQLLALGSIFTKTKVSFLYALPGGDHVFDTVYCGDRFWKEDFSFLCVRVEPE